MSTTSIVWFRSDYYYNNLFIINTRKENILIPKVGDSIGYFSEKDYRKATFRVKGNDKRFKTALLNYIVIKVTYTPAFNEWECIIEPTARSLARLLSIIKTK